MGGLGALHVSQIKKPRIPTLLSHLILSQILLLAMVRMRYLSPALLLPPSLSVRPTHANRSLRETLPRPQ